MPNRLVTRLVAVLLLLAAPLAGEAQQTAKAVRIAWLGLGSPDPEVLHILDGFKLGLREAGYIEGQNVAFEYRWADGQSTRLPELAAELVRLKVDIIAVASTAGVLAAKQATGTIPIISIGPDPEALGLGSRLARPGGNITGATLVAGPQIGGKYLALLKETAPKVSRVALLMRPESASHTLFLKEIEAAARTLKIQLQPVVARTPDDFGTAFSAMGQMRADAVIVLADPIFLLHRRRLADLAAKNRLPAMYGLTEHAESGGLIAYSANFAEVARRSATHVDRILKGARPGDLPIEQPVRFELIVNARAAKALGLPIPASVLAQASRVIE